MNGPGPDLVAGKTLPVAWLCLSFAQRMDLHACAKRHLATAGTYDYPHGDAIRLRTGRALARRGLVEVGNRWSANRYTRWRPTSAGIALVKAVLELGWHPSWRKSY